MRWIKIIYTGISAQAAGDAASGQIDTLRASFSFTSDWDDYPVRTAVFIGSGNETNVILDEDNTCDVPYSVTEKSGSLKIGVFGTAGEGEDMQRYTGKYVSVSVAVGTTPADGEEPTDEQVSAYEQMLARMAAAELSADEAAQRANESVDGIQKEINTALEEAKASGAFDGADGADGKDGYTPVKNVDYFDGADGKDGYTPVKNVDYFDGADGKDGYTPQRGTDYWTAADIASMQAYIDEKITNGEW